ncbi:MAG: ABC transporter substrate-binding protein [Clostridiales bacterium]|jgi:YaeC family lipoprotein|nr:ABC transporter substrate-binding protein [Clostridiales bacterium]
MTFKINKLIATILSLVISASVLASCSSGQTAETSTATTPAPSAENAAATEPIAAADADPIAAAEADPEIQVEYEGNGIDDAIAANHGDPITIKGVVDLVPHSELVEFVKPKLAEKGYIIEIVGTAADETTNEKTSAGDLDFNFFQHFPYLSEYNEINGANLVNAGDIHVEPISAYSDKYATTAEIPENATVAIPNNATNEYRALRILEIAGFIKLNESTATSLKASLNDVDEYLRPIAITELDANQIIPLKDDFDFFIVNVNKAIEAKIASTVLFREGSDSPYANIIAVKAEDASNPAVSALVRALQSNETRRFIIDKYNGAVIPAKLDLQAAQQAASIPEPQPIKWKIDIQASTGSTCGLPVHIAKSKGFFEAEGIDVTLVSGNFETQKAGLASGNYYVANGDFQFFPSVQQGLEIRIIGGLHVGCIKTLVPPESEIQGWADLKGKNIGIDEMGGTPHAVASMALAQFGIDPLKDVTWVVYPADQAVEASRKGEIDAFASWDPYATLAERDSGFRVISDLATDPLFAGKTCCFLYASQKQIDQNPELIQAIARAYRNANDWIRSNYEEAARTAIEEKFVATDDYALVLELAKNYEFVYATSKAKEEIKYFAENLRGITGFLDADTDPQKFADDLYYDAFSY